MAFSVTICLTTPTTDADNFSIYHTSAVAGNLLHSGITKTSLANYVVTGIPDGTTELIVKSMNDCPCSVSIELEEVIPPPPVCNLDITNYSTTAPSNLAGDNGVVTVNFTGGTSPVTCTLSGVSKGTVTSPFQLSGLTSNTTYTLILTDANNCTDQISFTLGQTTFTFDADYMMLTYEFSDGLDLDTRTRIVTPNVGQDTQNKYIGWSCQFFWPTTGDPYLSWSGDNTGTGFESVLVDLTKFSVAYPSATSILLDMRGFWFNVVGVNPVNVAATLWKGGTPVKSGFLWTNSTATATFNIDSVGKVVTSQGLPNKASSSGERIATLYYSLATGQGAFNNNDTTTPSV